jgi:hypothetical protein
LHNSSPCLLLCQLPVAYAQWIDQLEIYIYTYSKNFTIFFPMFLSDPGILSVNYNQNLESSL